MSVKLSWRTIGELNQGSAGVLIDRAIADAIHDLDDRGQEDNKARKVNVTLVLEPRKDGEAEASVEVKLSLPAYQTAQHVCGRVRSGGELALLFEGLSPERPDQRALPIVDNDEEIDA